MTSLSHVINEAKFQRNQVYNVDERRSVRCTCRRLATFSVIAFLIISCLPTGLASDAERHLVEELFDRQNYNPMIRPVKNLSETIKVRFEMSLIQLIMLDERNQIMKSNIWLRLIWPDYQLQWDPNKFDNIEVIRILPDRVWKPDIVLFNNADGRFEVSFKANVLVYPDSTMMWIPCAIYKSSCNIDVKYFPFDEQSCDMNFGSWTYDGDEVTITPYTPGFYKVDLTDYEKSGSWDVFNVVATLTEEIDPDDGHKISRAKYTIEMRRKTLFYSVNLIIPSVLVSSLSMVVFYLPAMAGERITMSVSILLALVVYLQVLVTNILPPSSISLPLYAKYLLFTVIIDVCCIANTVIVLNCSYKTPRTHQMSGWIRVLFLKWLPRMLFMQRPGSSASDATSDGIDQTLGASIGRLPTQTPESVRRGGFGGVTLESVDVHHPECQYGRMASLRQRQKANEAAAKAGPLPPLSVSPEINKAIEAVRFVGAHLKNEDDFDEVVDDWHYVSLVVDRMLFFTYMFVSVVATCSILIKTPLFDSFNQADYKETVRIERFCRDKYSPYDKDCSTWYPVLCNGEYADIYEDQCNTWKNLTMSSDALLF